MQTTGQHPEFRHPAPAATQAPGVSVIIPAYNYAQFLPQAIDSALAQNVPDLELIVVDDGSTDNTREIAARYGDRLRYIHQENAGLPAARNTGIKAATRPYIAFLDADDFWRPDMLAVCLEAFAELPDDYALIACRHERIDAEERPLLVTHRDRDFHGEVSVRDLLLKTRFATSGVVAKRQVFASCGTFDLELTSSEDRDMWIRIAHRGGRLHLLPERLVLIRDHPGSMSKNAARMAQNMRRVLRKARRAGCVARWRLGFWARAGAFCNYQVAWMYHAEGRQAAAIRCLLISLLRWPCFWRPARLDCPFLFRLRALRRFICHPVPRGKA